MPNVLLMSLLSRMSSFADVGTFGAPNPIVARRTPTPAGFCRWSRTSLFTIVAVTAALAGNTNVSTYPWVGNWLFVTQRYTGIIAFAYIGWHLYTERWLTHGRSTYANVAEDMQNPWYLVFFIVGVLASSFHLGVGTWNFLCKWGLAATVKAQQAAGRFGAFVGVAFSVVEILIILSFRFDWHPFSAYLPTK